MHKRRPDHSTAGRRPGWQRSGLGVQPWGVSAGAWQVVSSRMPRLHEAQTLCCETIAFHTSNCTKASKLARRLSVNRVLSHILTRPSFNMNHLLRNNITHMT